MKSGQMNTSLGNVFDGGVIGGGLLRVGEPLVQLPVLREVGAVGEPLVARRAGVGPLARVQPQVLLERPELREGLLADVAGEGPLAPVAPQVRVVRVLVQERLPALIALPRLHACTKKER